MKPLNKIFIALSLSTVTTITWAVDAEEIENRVKQLDTNNDGGVSMAEAKAGDAWRIIKNFDKLDADKNGEVTALEIEAANK